MFLLLQYHIKIASTSQMDNTHRYRLVLYNVTTGQIEQNVESRVDRNVVVKVTPGNDYQWFAYSYNSPKAVDEPLVENNQMAVQTFADREFLWISSGSTPITATVESIPVNIIFEHKVAEFVIEIDTENLFGEITDIEVALAETNTFSRGVFDIRSGSFINVSPYTTSAFTMDDFKPLVGSSSIYQAKLYTTDPQSLSNVNMSISKLTVQQSNGDVKELVKSTDVPKSVAFTFNNPSVSKSHVASLNLKYRIPTKTILHVTGNGNNDDHKWSFAAQPYERNLSGSWSAAPASNFGPFNMLHEPRNFGSLANSVVYTDGFIHRRCMDVGELDKKLTTPDSIPDIVVIAVYYKLDANDVTELVKYINNGGVVIMMTDSGVPAEVPLVEGFLRTFLGNTAGTITLSTEATYNGGTFFKLDPTNTINDHILNGPFGNLRDGNWGVDTHPLVVADNLPIGSGPNEVTLYSATQARNRPETSTKGNMFKHNSKSFFWIGDGSFLSTPNGSHSGWSTGYHGEPFATVKLPSQPGPDPLHNYEHYPVPKRYGQDYNGTGYTAGDMVHNAPLFANLMTWALFESERNGINKGK